MHSDPQISLHEMASPFRLSHGGRIHRCCTAQFIRSALRDKITEQTNNATRQDRSCFGVQCVLASLLKVHNRL